MSEYGHKLKFDKEGKAVCPESKAVYELVDGAVRKAQ
jgi:UDP-2-acetamido-3-amino-2,3-dideoxy-glucuronate N-acetyltransferase